MAVMGHLNQSSLYHLDAIDIMIELFFINNPDPKAFPNGAISTSKSFTKCAVLLRSQPESKSIVLIDTSNALSLSISSGRFVMCRVLPLFKIPIRVLLLSLYMTGEFR